MFPQFLDEFLGVGPEKGIGMEYWVVLEGFEIYRNGIWGGLGRYWGGIFGWPSPSSAGVFVLDDFWALWSY